MSFVQRAWLYITRKKLKTLILLAILLCMSTIMLSGFAIKHSTDAAAQSLDKTLKAGFTLGNNPRTNPGTARGSGTVSNKDINAVKNLEGVMDYVKRQNATVDFINTKLVVMTPRKTSSLATPRLSSASIHLSLKPNSELAHSSSSLAGTSPSMIHTQFWCTKTSPRLTT